MAGVTDRSGQTQLDVRIELGHAHLTRQEAAQLAAGSMVILEQRADEPVDVYVNNRLVARGQLQVLKGNFCVRITELAARESLPAAA